MTFGVGDGPEAAGLWGWTISSSMVSSSDVHSYSLRSSYSFGLVEPKQIGKFHRSHSHFNYVGYRCLSPFRRCIVCKLCRGQGHSGSCCYWGHFEVWTGWSLFHGLFLQDFDLRPYLRCTLQFTMFNNVIGLRDTEVIFDSVLVSLSSFTLFHGLGLQDSDESCRLHSTMFWYDQDCRRTLSGLLCSWPFWPQPQIKLWLTSMDNQAWCCISWTLLWQLRPSFKLRRDEIDGLTTSLRTSTL